MTYFRRNVPVARNVRSRAAVKAVVESLEVRQLLSGNLLPAQAIIASQIASPGLNAIPLTSGPTLTTPAAATPSPVTGTSTSLSVLGSDPAGESNLTYTWASTGTPPAAVAFSINGTNASKNTGATFTQAGSYSFQVTLTDSAGYTASSSVNVTVNQTATSVAVTAASSTLAAGANTQLSASELDQFGAPMATQPTFTWSVTSGTGTVTASGLFTAGTAESSTNVRAAVSGGLTGNAGITVVTTLAWYQMNSSHGTTLTDSSGNNHNGTLTGTASFAAGISGNALSLNGGNGNLPTGIVSDLTNFTISAWVKVTALSNWARIFDFGTGTTDYMFLTPDAGTTNALRFAITNSSNGNEQQLNGPAMSTGVWTHLAVTLSGNTGTLYVNGSAVATNTSMTLHPSSLGSTNLNYLGKSQFAADPALAGFIDDFRIYSVALSAQQIQELAFPSIVNPAAASANPVTATTTTLSVLGADVTAGASALTYTWATTGTPPATVSFSANGTNAASTTTATFTTAGTYNFTVTIVNPAAGLSTTSSVVVTVNQTLSSIAVTPVGLAIRLNSTQQFTATGSDQFGTVLVSQPTFSFTLGSGSVGSITASGLYSSLGTAGSASIIASNGSISGNTPVTVTSAAPTVVTPAAAAPNPVTGTTANLSVLGGDATGESNLQYTWATIGTPPAPVVFSANGTNAAKNTVATFTAAGSYNFRVTLTNGSGLTALSTVSVTVNQTATSISVSSPSTTIAAGAAVQFTATELDQFGAAMATQPAINWSIVSGAGTISTSGLYTAAATGGSVTIGAAVSGGPSGSTIITVIPTLAWYQMNASSGSTIVDSSGNNQTGTLTGSTSFVPGVTGNALNFTGGYATLPNGIVSTLTSFTIAVWVNPTTLSNWQRVFDFGSGTSNYMFLTTDAGTTNALRFGIVANSGTEQDLNGPALSVGVWTHIAITLSGTSATMYVNGIAVATNTSMTFHPSSLGSTTQNYLGKSQYVADPALNGSIDDFRLYGSALSQQQVQQVAMLTLPTGWTDSDIGSPADSGSAFFIPNTGLWTVDGGGADINGTSDQFNFASTPLAGDIVLTAEVTSVGDSNALAKAGLMLRSSTAAGSIEASVLMTPDSGIDFETRSATGGVTTVVQTPIIEGPVWLQLDRYGSNVSAYYSNDDVNWYPIGGSVTVPLGTQVLAGLAVTSHVNTSISGSSFFGVSAAGNAAPTIVTAAAAGPATFTGYSTALSVAGADDAGAQFLTYTWAVTGSPPAPVTFSTNAKNAAQRTQATFTASGTYNLTVTITDPGGLSVRSTVVVVVSVPPAPPVGITAAWSGSTVNVAWQSVTGAVSYNIYRSSVVGGEGSAAYATGIATTSFTDNSVTPGTTYYYQVTAVGAGSLESGRSFETVAMTGPFTKPIISEFMASNSSTLIDSDGDYDDWLELYNPTATTATLTGDYLTDSAKDLNEWQIPWATLAPGSFLIIFADSENDTDSAGVFHTNFGISSSGGYLALVASDGTTVLSSYTYGQQASDIAYGIGMSQTGSVVSYGGPGFLTATPDALNGPVIATGITAEPTFNYPDGFYSTTLQLTISSTTAGASIYYTLDGTAPSPTNGTLYNGAITVSGETNIRAMAVSSGNLPSAAAASSYIYTSQVLTQASNGQAPAGWPVDWGYSLVHYGMDPTVVNNPLYSGEIGQDLLDLPSLSLTLNLADLFNPVTGIYSESASTTELDAASSIELINPGGTPGFQADVGLSLKGDYSAISQNGSHGFDVHFSSKYGQSELDYPLFGPNAAQAFNDFQIRVDQNNSWAYSDPQSYIGIRDEFSSSLLAEVGQPAEHYKICFLYIDGMFWGLYDIIEKPDANFAASYFGGSASDYDALKATNLTATSGGTFGVEAEQGTLSAWDQLFSDVSTLDLSSNTNYQLIQGNNADGTPNAADPNLLDVNNLINYMLVIYYTGNYDAPYSTFIDGPNNFYAIRPIDGSMGFQFIATDSEWSLLSVNQNSVNLAPTNITSAQSAGPAYLFQKLEANADFRVLVGDTIEKDFFNGGPMSVTNTTALFNSLAAQIQGPVVTESARWGDATRPGDAYTRDNDWQPLINSMLSSYIPQRTAIVVAQLEAVGLYPATPVPPTFSQYGGTIPSGFQLTMTGAATIYYTLDGSDPQNSDGSLSSTALAYSSPISLSGTTEVKARVYSGGSWSALVDETFVSAASSVRITELNYDPGKPPTGSTYNNDDFEFVELENFSSQSVNLEGVAFTDGITYTFGNVTLGPWQVGVLVHNTAAFESRYGTGINIIGDYLSTGESFSNSGESVELVDATGNVLDDFDYTPCILAYPTAHGKGASLEVLDPDGPEDLNLATSWRASTVTNGTPGTIPLLLGSSSAYLMLDADGQHIDLWNSSTDSASPAESLPIAEVYAISFNPAAATDSLTIDFSNGNPLGVASIVYAGGSAPSPLTIIGTSSADTLAVNGTAATFSSAFGSAVISYSNASSITFDGNGGADTLTQSAQPGNAAPLVFNGAISGGPSSADTLNVNAGTYTFAAPSAGSGAPPLSLAALSIGATAQVSILSAAAHTDRWLLSLGSLAIAGSTNNWTGHLDLGGNDLLVQNGNLGVLTNQILGGYNGSAWNGPGITSSMAAADSTHLTALGIILNGNTYGSGATLGTFDGTNPAPTDVLIKYTYLGDTNLDGIVDGSDYTNIDNGFNNHLSGWANGNFNYDAAVDGSDYTLIDNAFNTQGASLAAVIAPATAAAMVWVNPAAGEASQQAAPAMQPGTARLNPAIPTTPTLSPVFHAGTPISFDQPNPSALGAITLADISPPVGQQSQNQPHGNPAVKFGDVFRQHHLNPVRQVLHNEFTANSLVTWSPIP